MLLSTFFKQFKFPLLTVRGTNVYGARQQLFKIIPRTVIYLKLGKTIELHGGGTAVKSYIHIRDISRGEAAILEKGRAGEIYNLSPDQGTAVKDVVKTLCDKMGKRFDEAVKTVAERPGQDAAYVIDSTKARTELGWSTKISIEEGLADVINWVDEYWDEIKSQPLEYQHKA
jgi:dTDP-glucose 4,6-dehydratase